MKYEITIKQTREIKKTISKKWGQVGDKEVERDSCFSSRSESESFTRITPVYDYTPEVETLETEERTVLMQ